MTEFIQVKGEESYVNAAYVLRVWKDGSKWWARTQLPHGDGVLVRDFEIEAPDFALPGDDDGG